MMMMVIMNFLPVDPGMVMDTERMQVLMHHVHQAVNEEDVPGPLDGQGGERVNGGGARVPVWAAYALIAHSA